MNGNLNYIISRDAFFWALFILVLVISILIYGMGRGKKICRSVPNRTGSIVLLIITIMFLTFCVGADKQAYTFFFEETCKYGILHRDYIGWELLEYVVSLFTHSATFFFFVVASVYVYLNYWFCKKNTKNFLPLFIAVLSFMGFYAYGVNTIKSGLSLALVLYSFALYENNKKSAWIVAVPAIMIHFSIIIPLIAFEVSHRLKAIKYYYAIWIVCLILSLAYGNFFQLYLGGVFGVDSTYSGYLLETETERYRSGFRYDFLFYSMIPIIWARFFLKIIIMRNGYYTLKHT